VLKYAVKTHEELVKKVEPLMAKNSGFNTMTMFQPITKSIVEKSVKYGGNVIGLEDRVADSNGIMWLQTLQVKSAEDEATAMPYMQAWSDDVNAYATKLGLNWDWHYLNYAQKNQDPIGAYGSESLAKIKAAAAKYDPKCVFQKLRKTGFHIPEDC
jgi:hypothetical protein